MAALSLQMDLAQLSGKSRTQKSFFVFCIPSDASVNENQSGPFFEQAFNLGLCLLSISFPFPLAMHQNLG